MEDAGTETLRRFRYQALVTLPICLKCALGDEIIKVIPEHLEDIAISYGDRWRFVQVKSRDPELGLWTLGDLTGEGGALRSLNRTHQQTLSLDASLELILEGAPSPRNPIIHLRARGDHANPDLISRVSDALEISESEATAFIARVTLTARPPPSRDAIEAVNHNLIHQQAPDLSHEVVKAVHQRLLTAIEDAMRAGELGENWPTYVTHPGGVPGTYSERLAAKTLTRDQLREVIAPITSAPRPLLLRIADTSRGHLSNLERKMIEGGADEQLILDARNLRLNAIQHIERRVASDIFSEDAQLTDLRERLLIHANSRRSLHLASTSPARSIWSDLVQNYSTHAASIDPSRLLAQDSMLLLGKLCDLSDECAFNWGVVHA